MLQYKVVMVVVIDFFEHFNSTDVYSLRTRHEFDRSENGKREEFP